MTDLIKNLRGERLALEVRAARLSECISMAQDGDLIAEAQTKLRAVWDELAALSEAPSEPARLAALEATVTGYKAAYDRRCKQHAADIVRMREEQAEARQQGWDAGIEAAANIADDEHTYQGNAARTNISNGNSYGGHIRSDQQATASVIRSNIRALTMPAEDG